VLDQDAVAGERRRAGREAALEHDGLAGREHLGRVAVVDDLDAGPVVGDRERDPPAGRADVVRERALQAEPAVAELVALGQGLVGVAEVEGGVAEPAHDDPAAGAERHRQDHGRGDSAGGPASPAAARPAVRDAGREVDPDGPVRVVGPGVRVVRAGGHAGAGSPARRRPSASRSVRPA
jgi:hypothetical protein